MFISKREYLVEVHAILQEDVDFTKNDLTENVLVGGKLLELTSKARDKIAFNKGFLSMMWAGHYNPESKTVECAFRNPIFVDEDNGMVVMRNA